MTWTDIVDKGYTPEEFTAYVGTLQFGIWQPQFVVVHNTSSPTLAQYHGFSDRGISGEQWLRNLVGYYRDQMGWSAGPHLFIGDDKIWCFTPLTMPGVHSPSWNAVSWGIEMIGEYEVEPFDPDVRDNAVSALATLHTLRGLDPQSIHFHKEDPKTTHKQCPGKNVDKYDLIARVTAAMAIASPGEHLPPRPA